MNKDIKKVIFDDKSLRAKEGNGIENDGEVWGKAGLL